VIDLVSINGEKMKILYTLISILLLAGCNMSNESTDMDASQSAVVEYVWQTKGPNYSDEALEILIDSWNQKIDAGGYDMVGANILVPDFEPETHDFVWVLRWPSMEARNYAWDHFQKNYDEDWNQERAGIFSDNDEDVYAFTPTLGREMRFGNGETFEAEFNSCDFNDGYGQDDLVKFKKDFNDYIDNDEMENGEGTFWYVMLDPLFEPTSNLSHSDYLWLNIWGNQQDKEEGYAGYSETDLQKQADAFSTCVRFPHSGRVIR
jgi:hypothetical protein